MSAFGMWYQLGLALGPNVNGEFTFMERSFKLWNFDAQVLDFKSPLLLKKIFV